MREWSLNDTITSNGETHTIREWARKNIGTGLTVRVILLRLRNGWEPEMAVIKDGVKTEERHEKEVTYEWVFEHVTSGAGRYVRRIKGGE